MLLVLDRENLQGASGGRVVAGDEDREWGTSGVSERTTFFLVVYQLPPECNQCGYDVFAGDVKMLSPRSQSGLLLCSLNSAWNLSIHWDLPINPTKCNYIAIGRANPLQLFFASGSPGDSTRVANVEKNPWLSRG